MFLTKSPAKHMIVYAKMVVLYFFCCLTDTGLEVDTDSCKWQYSPNQGEHLTCRSELNEVMTGRCGSETMAKCDSSKVHGIQCCQIKALRHT